MDWGDWFPQLLGWGTNNVLFPPNFLAVVSCQKAINFTASSHQNAGFSIGVFINFPGVIPWTLTVGGVDPFGSQRLARPLTGRKRPGVGSQTLVPLNLSAVVAPLQPNTILL